MTKTQPSAHPAGDESGDIAENPKRFGLLVCVDGSEESNRALHYAVRIGSGTDADLTLLYVRPIDQGLRTGGLQLSVARENMLDWGLELPGTTVLREARDMLIDLGWLHEEWEREYDNIAVGGDPLGSNVKVYTNEEGRSITLKLAVAPTITQGVLDEYEAGNFDLTIIARSKTDEPSGPGYISPDVAYDVALEHPGSVLVVRLLEESHGHLVCVSDNEGSIEGARRDAEIAARCACPVYLFSVAKTEADRGKAQHAIAAAKRAIEQSGIKVSGETIAVGDPVERIVEEGIKYSVIVVSRFQSRHGWKRIFSNSIAYKVLAKAQNSVLIRR